MLSTIFDLFFVPHCQNEALAETRTPFELILVINDDDEKTFGEYVSSLKFPAIPFVEQGVKRALKNLLQIEETSMLILVDALTGEVIRRDGFQVFHRQPQFISTTYVVSRLSAF